MMKDLSLQAVWAEIDAPVYAGLGNHDYRAGINGSGSIWEASLGYGISPALQGVFPGSRSIHPLTPTLIFLERYRKERRNSAPE